jgi:hypothetical protein
MRYVNYLYNIYVERGDSKTSVFEFQIGVMQVGYM